MKNLPLFAQEQVSPEIASNQSLDLNRTLETVEKQLLERAMRQTEGNKTEAAKALGIKTSALYYKLEKYRLI